MFLSIILGIQMVPEQLELSRKLVVETHHTEDNEKRAQFPLELVVTSNITRE